MPRALRTLLGALAGGLSSSARAIMTDPRVVVVTGANKGIGFAIAKKVVETENHVCIVAARNEELGRKACAELAPLAKGGPTSVMFKQLDITDDASIEKFATEVEGQYGRVDALVDNAGFAFKGSDSTPFKEQAAPTFAINFYGTVKFTERMLPLVKRSDTGRIVVVASSSGHLSILPSDKLRQTFTSPSLTKTELVALADKFVKDVQEGTHKENGWPNTCYGMSKLCIIAYTKVLARQEAEEGKSPQGSLLINACCPGYVATDMSSHRGHLTPEEGARTPYKLAVQLENGGPSGEFWKDERIIEW